MIIRRKMNALWSRPDIQREQLAMTHAMARISSARHVVWDESDEPEANDVVVPPAEPLDAIRATLGDVLDERDGIGASVVGSGHVPR